MSEWSSVEDDEGLPQAPEYPTEESDHNSDGEDDGGLPQAPEYPTEEDVAAAEKPRDASPPTPPALSTDALTSSSPTKVTTPQTHPPASSGAAPVASSSSSSLSGAPQSRDSAEALKAMTEQRRLECQRRASPSATPSSSSSPPPQMPATATSEGRSLPTRETVPTHVEVHNGSPLFEPAVSSTATAADAGAGEDDFISPLANEPPRSGDQRRDPHSPDSMSSSVSASGSGSISSCSVSALARRRQEERRDSRAMSLSHTERQLYVQQMFVVNYELEGRNKVVRAEGDELAQILRAYKIFVETFEATTRYTPPPPSPPREEASVAQQRDGLIEKASSQGMHSSLKGSSSAAPLFTITTVYRRPQTRTAADAAVVSEAPNRREGPALTVSPGTDARNTHHHRDGDGGRRTSKDSNTQRSARRLHVKPAILYVCLPPSWWLAISDGGSIASAAVGRLIRWLVDLCVVLVLLLATLLIGALCDAFWLRIAGTLESA